MGEYLVQPTHAFFPRQLAAGSLFKRAHVSRNFQDTNIGPCIIGYIRVLQRLRAAYVGERLAMTEELFLWGCIGDEWGGEYMRE